MPTQPRSFYVEITEQYTSQKWWDSWNGVDPDSDLSDLTFYNMAKIVLSNHPDLLPMWKERLQWSPELQERLKTIVLEMGLQLE